MTLMTPISADPTIADWAMFSPSDFVLSRDPGPTDLLTDPRSSALICGK
jgi:hypothetical protein